MVEIAKEKSFHLRGKAWIMVFAVSSLKNCFFAFIHKLPWQVHVGGIAVVK